MDKKKKKKKIKKKKKKKKKGEPDKTRAELYVIMWLS